MDIFGMLLARWNPGGDGAPLYFRYSKFAFLKLQLKKCNFGNFSLHFKANAAIKKGIA